MLVFLKNLAKFNFFRQVSFGAIILIAGSGVFYLIFGGNENGPVNLMQDHVFDAAVKIDYRHPYELKYQPSVSEDPHMVIDEQWFNLGKVSEEGSRQVSFKIKNEGKSDLVIEKASSTCSCLAAELSSVIIPPGKSSQVEVFYSSTNFEQQSQIIRRGLIFLTNDPHFPQAEVWIQVKLK